MDRRNKSDDFFRQQNLAFSNLNKKATDENKENFLMDNSISPETKQLRHNLLDLNTFIEENVQSNKNFIRIIITKFHEFTMKLMNHNKQLYFENQTLKQKIESPIKLNTVSANTNNEINGNNVSDIFSLKKKEDALENENKFLKGFIDDELECFNQIMIEFNSQFNDMQSKEDGLRKQIIDKCDEITRINSEMDELKRTKVQLISELKNIRLKSNDVKRE